MLIGKEERVPFARHDMFMQKWKAIAKILLKGYRDVRYFPLILSRAFIDFTLFDQVDIETLRKGFLNFIAMGRETLSRIFNIHKIAKNCRTSSMCLTPTSADPE